MVYLLEMHETVQLNLLKVHQNIASCECFEESFTDSAVSLFSRHYLLLDQFKCHIFTLAVI